ncbi:L,D-transpeptidase family protein [Aestuariivirga sp.]|uniref:L,D-transpeptidase family protein n=1 Tax=Aestuariivirga sp. TaxID=2650926 RepID=UPI0039E4C3FB
MSELKLHRRSILLLGAAWAAGLASQAHAQTTETTSSISTPAPKPKLNSTLATHTGIVADKGEAAMLTLGSEEALTGAIAHYQEIVAGGGWPTLPNKKVGKTTKGPQIVLLRQRLVAEGYLPFDALTVATPEVFDDEMSQAITAFQINHGVAQTGTVGDKTLAELNVPAEARLAALQENLIRVQIYSKGIMERMILVNIPSMQLETSHLDRVYSRHNVVVGKLDRPSPALMSKVSDVNFNPYWKIPASIVEKDIVPKYLADSSYLAQMHIRVFDGVDGPEIDPSTIDWSSTPPERYFFRQDPGDFNSLGLVKINFPNEFMVYMHDTPHRELFGGNARLESSGCVRIDQVKTVVDWVLDGQNGFDSATYDANIASHENSVVKVDAPIGVRFMYLTAWATEDGAVNFRPDVYGLDGTGFVLGQPEPKTN